MANQAAPVNPPESLASKNRPAVVQQSPTEPEVSMTAQSSETLKTPEARCGTVASILLKSDPAQSSVGKKRLSAPKSMNRDPSFEGNQTDR